MSPEQARALLGTADDIEWRATMRPEMRSEAMNLKVALAAALADLAALRIEYEAHAALLTVTRGDRLRPRHREAYEAGRKAGIEEAAKECDAAIADCEDCGSNDYMRAFRRLPAAVRALAP